MKRLFEIDLKDYDPTDTVFSRPSARGIIFLGEKTALVYSRAKGYFKFPGGGIKRDESAVDALCREVREEVGLTVIARSIVPFGSVLRRQKSDIHPHTIFEQENFYYFCEVERETTAQELDDYERDSMFTLRAVTLDEAIAVNSRFTSDNLFDTVMVERDTQVLRRIKKIREKI